MSLLLGNLRDLIRELPAQGRDLDAGPSNNIQPPAAEPAEATSHPRVTTRPDSPEQERLLLSRTARRE